jgi:hypothetical protein
MADPREVTNRIGAGYFAETFPHDATIVYDPLVAGGSAQVGLAATIESDNLVTLIGDGEALLGKLVKVEPGGMCVVQTGGVMTLPGGDGATLTAMGKVVGDLGAAAAEGYIRVAASAGDALLARGIIENAADPTEVEVRLESAR